MDKLKNSFKIIFRNLYFLHPPWRKNNESYSGKPDRKC